MTTIAQPTLLGYRDSGSESVPHDWKMPSLNEDPVCILIAWNRSPKGIVGGIAISGSVSIRAKSATSITTNEDRDIAKMQAMRFIGRIRRLAKTDEHRSIDEIYKFFDDRLLDGDSVPIEECNAALEWANPAELSLSQIISFLIVTRRAGHKGRLPSRDIFFERSLRVLSSDRGVDPAKRILMKYR